MNEHQQKLAGAFASILGKRVKDKEQPILAEVNTRPVDNDRQQEKRQKRKERKTAATQRLLRQKDRRRPEVEIDEKEALLRKIATRGVVKLFNAVAEAQKPAASSSEDKPGSLSKEGFMQLLKKGAPGQHQPLAKGSQAAADDGVASGRKPQWDALQDDYMMKSTTLKHWDTQESESESDIDEDVTEELEQQEEELEYEEEEEEEDG